MILLKKTFHINKYAGFFTQKKVFFIIFCLCFIFKADAVKIKESIEKNKENIMTIKKLDHITFVTHNMDATIDFYCNVIGLKLGKHLEVDFAKSVYLYIPGQETSILHILRADADKNQPRFERFADLSKNNMGGFSTGSIDHFCLKVEGKSFNDVIKKLESMNVKYQYHKHKDFPLKQIWLLDPNGIRVELSF